MIVWRQHVRIDSSHGLLAAGTHGVSGADRLVRATPSEAYERHVVRVLNQIASSRVGALVVNRLTAIGRPLRIVPRVNLHQRIAQTPAAVSFDRGANRFAAGVTGREGEHGETNTGLVGTGRGARASIIAFSPGARLTSAQASVYAEDSALVHEMVHSLRALSGHEDGRGIGTHFHNIEEFSAILVENIYRSSTGRHRIRESHRMHDARSFDDRTHAGQESVNDLFRRIYAKPLARFREQEPQLASALATVTAPFNPLRV
ncbi:MAG: hypothetical protein JNL19_11710 [Burkholderiales bacterium]|nr:hypothetical protein [Burkholderiales bacterium]